MGLARSLTAHARELDDRTRAMDTRRVIDLALGVIMARAHCSSDAAFSTLRRQSQHTNTPLADVARLVLAGLGEPVGTAAPASPSSSPSSPGTCAPSWPRAGRTGSADAR